MKGNFKKLNVNLRENIIEGIFYFCYVKEFVKYLLIQSDKREIFYSIVVVIGQNFYVDVGECVILIQVE